jgi:hypothetical protein
MSMTPRDGTKQFTFGRNRELARIGNLFIVPGERFRKSWDTELLRPDVIQPKIGYSDEQLDAFYEGWVKPLSDVDNEFCGHKLSDKAKKHGLVNLNAIDLFDLAVNTNILPLMFPGSTNEQFAFGGVETIYRCDKSGHDKGFPFMGYVYDTDIYRAGLQAIAGGDFHTITRYMTEWGTILTLAECAGLEVVKEAAARLAQACLDSGESRRFSFYDMSWHYTYRTEERRVYGRTSPKAAHTEEAYQRITEVTSPVNAALLIMMMWSQTPTDTGFVPTIDEIQNIESSDYLARCIPLLLHARDGMKIGDQKPLAGSPAFELHTILTAAANDVDITLLSHFVPSST